MAWAVATSWITLVVLGGGFAFAPSLIARDGDDHLSDGQAEGGPSVVRSAFYQIEADTWLGGDVDDAVGFTLALRVSEPAWHLALAVDAPHTAVIETTRSSIAVRWRARPGLARPTVFSDLNPPHTS